MTMPSPDRHIEEAYERQYDGLWECRCGSWNDKNDTECWSCRPRECVECGKTWRAEQDPGFKNWCGPYDVPQECHGCRCREAREDSDVEDSPSGMLRHASGTVTPASGVARWLQRGGRTAS